MVGRKAMNTFIGYSFLLQENFRAGPPRVSKIDKTFMPLHGTQQFKVLVF